MLFLSLLHSFMCGAGQELLLQQNLMRRLENGGKEPLMLEEGKAAVVNIKGPMLLHRQQLVSLSLSDFLDLVKVTPPPPLPPQHGGLTPRVRQALRKWLGFPGAGPGHAQVSNAKAIQSTRALSKLPGRPWQGFPDC